MTKRRSGGSQAAKAKVAPVVRKQEVEGKFPDPVQIEVGDHVYVGEPADDKVHWEVDYIHPSALSNVTYPGVRLISGMTGRMRVAAYGDLTLHSKGKTPSQPNSASSEEWAAARGDGWTFFRRSDGRVVADGPEGRDGRDWPNLDAALVATRPVQQNRSE